MSRVLVALGAFIVATVAIIVIAQNGGQISNSVPAAVVGNMRPHGEYREWAARPGSRMHTGTRP